MPTLPLSSPCLSSPLFSSSLLSSPLFSSLLLSSPLLSSTLLSSTLPLPPLRCCAPPRARWQTRLLTRLLESACPSVLLDRIWLDVDREPTIEEMKKGVEEASYVVIFLTKGSLARWFCQLEVRHGEARAKLFPEAVSPSSFFCIFANRNGSRHSLTEASFAHARRFAPPPVCIKALAQKEKGSIILVNDEPNERPGHGGHSSFGGYIADAQKGDEIEIDGALGTTREDLFNIAAIPFYSDPALASVCVDLILQRADLVRQIYEPSNPPELELFEALSEEAIAVQCQADNEKRKRVVIINSRENPAASSVSHQLQLELRRAVPKILGSKKGSVVVAEKEGGASTNSKSSNAYTDIILYVSALASTPSSRTQQQREQEQQQLEARSMLTSEPTLTGASSKTATRSASRTRRKKTIRLGTGGPVEESSEDSPESRAFAFL